MYSSIVFIIDHPASSVDFAIRVFTIAPACTFPTKIAALRSTSPVLNLCIASEHVAAVFRPRSIPTDPVPADFGTSTLTHAFRSSIRP